MTRPPLVIPADVARLAAGETPPRWITIRAAADYLSCTDKTIRRLISAGKLEAFRLGDRAIRLDRNQIDVRIEAHPVRQGGDDEVTR